MPAFQALSARHWRAILILLILLGWHAVSVPFAAAQTATDASINQSVWQQKFGTPADSVLDSNGMKHSDEMIAGIPPGNGRFQVSTFSTSGSDPNRTFSSTFSSVKGKYYTVQGASLPSGTWGTVAGVGPIIGDDTPKTFNVSQSANPSYHYFRVIVQDNSTANDQVSDWAKAILGYATGSSIGSQSIYDHNSLATALDAQHQNVVTIAATDPSATQPNVNGGVAPNLGTFTISRSGYFLFSQITVNLSAGGTATPGVDYVALPSTITFPAGVKTQTIPVTPLYNPARTTSGTVSLTISGSAGFTVAPPTTAVVTVFPADLSYGTGLAASYYSNSNGTYANLNNLGGITGTYNYSSLTTSSTVTITPANPAVVTWTNHGLIAGSPVVFSTTGSLPTNLTAGTTYYVIPAGLQTNSFEVSATLGGNAVSTLGNAQSGTHTASTLPFATITYTDTTVSFAAGNFVNLSFTSGSTTPNLSTAVALPSGITAPAFDKSYVVTAANNTAKTFNVAISGTGLPASGTGNCFLSAVKTPTLTRLDPYVDYKFGYGLPSSGAGALPTSTTSGWVGRFDSYLTPGVFTAVTITNASPAVVTLSAHGLTAGSPVVFATTGTLPTGLSINTTYYVSATGLTTNTFQVSATNGGASVNTSSAGTGTQSILKVTTGSYSFQILADDGARVYLDVDNSGTFDAGETIIDAWTPGTATVTAVASAPVTLTAGTRYHIRVEYLQINGAATVQLQWKKPGDGSFSNIPGANAFLDATTSALGWTNQYWSNTSFAGLPRFADYPAQINLTWGSATSPSAPSQALPSADNFSIRWEGYVSSAAGGTYDFAATAADGVTLYLDLNQNGTFDAGETVLVAGGTPAGGSASNTTGIALAAGQRYKIRVDYTATTGFSLVNVAWKRHADTTYSFFNANAVQSADNLTIYRDSGATSTPGWWATYFFNATFTNPPMYSAQDTNVSTLNSETSSVTLANSSSTVTISNASPAVIGWTNHGLAVNTPVVFSVSGGLLPSGLTAGTTYFVSANGYSANSFQVSTAVSGASVNTTTNGSGTFTATTATIVSWPTHGLVANTPVVFTTTGFLPTGLTAGTTYFVMAAGLSANSFLVSTSAGSTTAVTTSGSQGGTQTATTPTYTYGTGKPPTTGLTTGGSSGDNWASRYDGYIKATAGAGTYSFETSVLPASGEFAHLILDGTEQIAYNSGGVNSTVTISTASPAMITWNGHNLAPNMPVVFSSTGTLPTPLTAGTTYYVISAGLTANTFEISTSVGGSALATTVAGTGTITATAGASPSVYSVSLSAGQIVHVVFEHYNLSGNSDPGLYWKVQGATNYAAITGTSGNLFTDAAATSAGVTASHWTNTSYYGDASFIDYPQQIGASFTSSGLPQSTSGAPALSFTTTNFSARWDTYLQPSNGGAVSFDIQAGAGARVFLDVNQNGNFNDAGEQLVFYSDFANTVVVDPWVAGASTAAPVHTATYNLVAGQRYKLRVEFYDSTSASMAQLRWQGDGPANATMAGIPNSNLFLDAGTSPQLGVLATYWPNTTLTDPPAYIVAENANPGIFNNFGTGRPVGTPQSNVTISIGANAAITWNNHGLAAGMPVVFMTSGALPTGLTAGTIYFVSTTNLQTNSFVVSDTAAHALAGTNNITTSGTPSGIQAAATIGFDNFSIRWAGQVLPQYSETYYFDGYVDDGCRIWVNNQLIVNRWPGGGVTDSIGSIALQAGVRYDIVMEYYEGSGNADAHLYWYSNSQAKQIVPTARLFPTMTGRSAWSVAALTTGGGTVGTSTVQVGVGNLTGISVGETVSGGGITAGTTVTGVDATSGTITLSTTLSSSVGTGTTLTFTTAAALPAITSPSSAVALMGSGSPFSYTITASNGGGNFTATGLPPGITLSNGMLSGTPTVAGNYQVTLTATNAAGTVTFTLNLLVLNTAGNCTRELFPSLAGPNISDLQNTIQAETAAGTLPTPDTVTLLEDAATNYATNTGERLRGYFTAPVTGNYYFWIAASNVAELWIADSSEAVTKLRRASVAAPGTASRTWNTQSNQQSPWLALVAGQQYYFEVLHNTGGAGGSGLNNHLSVAWYVDPTGTSAGSSRVDLQACKLEYSIVSPK